MMNPKKNNMSDTPIFIEEIKEEEIVDFSNSKNETYKKRKKNRIIIVLAVSLIIISTILAFAGFIYFDDEVNDARDKKVYINDNYKLFVTHSNSYFGGENIVFKDYGSENNAYVYRFDINNDNDVNLDYVVKIMNSNFGKDNIDMNKINYSLLKEDVSISFGNLKNVEVVKIHDLTIKSNTKDRLSLKVWSYDLDDEAFSFKVNVELEGGSHE